MTHPAFAICWLRAVPRLQPLQELVQILGFVLQQMASPLLVLTHTQCTEPF